MPRKQHTRRAINESLLSMRITHFRNLASMFEHSLEFQMKERLNVVEAAQVTPGINGEWMTEVIKDIDLSTNVPNLFRRSLFIAAYALLEFHLQQLAKECEERDKLPISVGELHGQGIERSRIYLKKIAAMPFPDTSSEWQEIKWFAALRNLLVHRFGRADDDTRDTKLRAWIESCPHLDLIPWGHVVWFEPTFLEHVLSKIEWLFVNLGYDLNTE